MSQTATTKQREIQRIADALSVAIAQHRLTPGRRLIESQIVDALQANRNHVQAALQRLALQHIVMIEPNKGAMVAHPEAQEAREIFIARRAIESAIVASITPEKMQRFALEIAAQQQAEHHATTHPDRRDIVRELSAFHLLLAKVSGNTVLSEILANLMVRSSLIVALYQRNDIPACQCAEHGAILRALQAGDSEHAQTIMLAHLDALEKELDLSEQQPDTLPLHQALSPIDKTK